MSKDDEEYVQAVALVQSTTKRAMSALMKRTKKPQHPAIVPTKLQSVREAEAEAAKQGKI